MSGAEATKTDGVRLLSHRPSVLYKVEHLATEPVEGDIAVEGLVLAGPGWVIFGALKQIVGLFLAVYLIANAVQTADVANQPVYQFLEIYTDIMPAWLALTLAVVHGLVPEPRERERGK